MEPRADHVHVQAPPTVHVRTFLAAAPLKPTPPAFPRSPASQPPGALQGRPRLEPPCSVDDLRRDDSRAGTYLDHPRKNRGSFDEYAFFLSEGAYRIPRDMNGFVAVMRHVAVLQGGVVYYVALAFRHSSRKSMASSRVMISLIRSFLHFS